MKKLLKLSLLAIGLLAVFCLFSCNREYKGKEIESIEYTTCSFMGGYTQSRRLVLSSGEILAKECIPWEDIDGEYAVVGTIDTDKNGEILNMLSSLGLFSLDGEYANYNVLDGGSWTYKITYADGTEKTSVGINAGPDNLFKEADILFFDLTGYELFGKVPQSYKEPPLYSLKHSYETENNDWCEEIVGLEPTAFNWRGRSVVKEQHKTVSIDATENTHHQVTLTRAQGEAFPTEVAVYACDATQGTQQPIEHTMLGARVNFEIEKNKSYLIVLTFPDGTAEYRFNTVSTEAER
ncbi:MAG: hypothetical protein J6B29_01530 [Clostridia bacterium]|nr:hypothetical protein [Clostridia bacterium]